MPLQNGRHRNGGARPNAGRPKGVRNHDAAWSDVEWGYDHRFDNAAPPNPNALVWRLMAGEFPDEVEEFLQERGYA